MLYWNTSLKRHSQPKLTIATVVFNGLPHIQATLESVTHQSYQNLEYIVIDGGSTDGSLHKISAYSNGIDRLISEPDRGIYDAMNKAVSLATGDWILFMNAGDVFSSPTVLEDLFGQRNYPQQTILYGSHYVAYGVGKMRLIQAPARLSFWKGSQFSHQACFIPLVYHKACLYDLKFKIAADYDFFLRARRNSIAFCRINYVVAQIIPGGVSDTMRSASIKERRQSLNSVPFSVLYFPLLLTYNSSAKIFKRLARLLLKKSSSF